MNIFEQAAKKIKQDEDSAFIENPVSNSFFEIKESSDNKKIGRQYPQVDSINLTLAHSITYHQMPRRNLKFDEIELYKSAKLTDIISSGAICADGLLLSEKILKIFKNYKLGKHKVFKAKVSHKGEKYDYGYLQIMNDLKNCIDYKMSSFYVTDMLGKPVSDFEINDIQEYEKMGKKIHSGEITEFKEYSYLKIKSAFFKNNSQIPDFFTLDPCGITLFISKRLRDELVNNNISGSEIRPTNKIITIHNKEACN